MRGISTESRYEESCCYQKETNGLIKANGDRPTAWPDTAKPVML